MFLIGFIGEEKKILLCFVFVLFCRKDRICFFVLWIVFVLWKLKEDLIVFRNCDIISDIRG